MEVDDGLISRLEKLARIKLDDRQRDGIKDELSNMIAMVDRLKEVDTSDVTALTHVHNYENVEREDSVKNEFDIQQGLENAPKVIDGHFAVPKVMD